jgi:hypothetical protein
MYTVASSYSQDSILHSPWFFSGISLNSERRLNSSTVS